MTNAKEKVKEEEDKALAIRCADRRMFAADNRAKLLGLGSRIQISRDQCFSFLGQKMSFAHGLRMAHSSTWHTPARGSELDLFKL